MSRIHVLFVKHEQTTDFVTYRIHSPDFADNQLIGEITFSMRERRYQFVPMGALFGKAVIPPAVFELPEEKQEKIISRDFPGCSYGGWTRRIARMASRLLSMDEFPDELCGVT